MRKGRKVDLVRVVEAAYQVEQTEQEWLLGALGAVEAGLDQGLGCTAFLYDASDPGQLRVRSLVGASGPRDQAIVKAIEASSPERVAWVFRTQACRTASEGPSWEQQPAARLFRQWGIEDLLFVNGLDPSGVGCFFTAKLAERRGVTPEINRLWSRVAAHLGAGYRLHRRLADQARQAPAAVLSPGGRVEHAEGEAAAPDTRAALREAVRAVERARGGMRDHDPPGALESWRPLVVGRWSLLDQFEENGKRYVVARHNQPTAAGPAALSSRERQALGYASMGHWNKFIAYEMGIAPSTVRVLLARACAKLGARSRSEAIAAFVRSREGEPTRPRPPEGETS